MERTPKEEADHILSLYAAIQADVEYNKNLEKHLVDIQQTLTVINKKVDDWLIERKDVSTLYEVGYFMYLLRDIIIDKLKKG